jgi:hypothetical protein
MRLAVFLLVFVVLLASTAHARQLQQKGKEEKPGGCQVETALFSSWSVPTVQQPLAVCLEPFKSHASTRPSHSTLGGVRLASAAQHKMPRPF